jgi:hypothetical protein
MCEGSIEGFLGFSGLDFERELFPELAPVARFDHVLIM